MTCNNNYTDRLLASQSHFTQCMITEQLTSVGYYTEIFYPKKRTEFAVTPFVTTFDLYQSHDINYEYPKNPNKSGRFLINNLLEKKNISTGNAIIDSFMTGDETYILSSTSEPINSVVRVYTSGNKERFWSFRVRVNEEIPLTGTLSFYKIILEPYT